MSEIPEILINTVNIPKVDSYYFSTVESLPQSLPVTLQIGNPIIEMPGCVKFNEVNTKSKNLVNEDERGNKVLCDAGSPVYEAIDYQPEELIYVEDAPVPNIKRSLNKKKSNKKNDQDESKDEENNLDTPNPTFDNIPQKNEKSCPAPNQPRVGDLTRSGDEIVIGHEIQGNICVVLYEPTSSLEKLLPNASQVSTTAAIALVATASAAATPVLLKLIKPLIKQLIKRIKALFGKKDRERFKGLQRKKKLISELNGDD